MNDKEIEVIEANREVASLVAQMKVKATQNVGSSNRHKSLPEYSNKVQASEKPANFWAWALSSNEERSDHSGLDSMGLVIKMAAAKLRAGDTSFVFESCLGQVNWLSATAVELKEQADTLPLDSAKRSRLLDQSFKFQNSASKLLLSLGALGVMHSGGEGS